MLSVASNATIGAIFALANAAPTNGLRIEGQSVIGKASGEDARDMLSAHTSATAHNNVTGYPIYFDGKDIRFERIPEGIIKYNKKIVKKK